MLDAIKRFFLGKKKRGIKDISKKLKKNDVIDEKELKKISEDVIRTVEKDTARAGKVFQEGANKFSKELEKKTEKPFFSEEDVRKARKKATQKAKSAIKKGTSKSKGTSKKKGSSGKTTQKRGRSGSSGKGKKTTQGRKSTSSGKGRKTTKRSTNARGSGRKTTKRTSKKGKR